MTNSKKKVKMFHIINVECNYCFLAAIISQVHRVFLCFTGGSLLLLFFVIPMLDIARIPA